MRESSIESFDGTRIVYRTGGRGDRWLVVANGYGGTFGAWHDVLARLEDRCRWLIWDYRGLHRSAIPRDLARLRIGDHLRDLDRIRAALGIERWAMAGWSVGVQVALEQYRRAPDRVEALALVNGTHGRVLERSTGSVLARRMLPRALRGLRAMAPLVAPGVLPPLRAVAARRWSPALMRRAGIFNGDAASLGEAMRDVLTLDYRIYTHMILLADEHDTDDLLPRVRVPTLVVGGDRDAITPPPLSRRTAERIPGCRYQLLRGATHYGLMEQPERYAGLIGELLDEARTPAPAT
jgi:pimeloyl-ACP methyl ester carboxylesterase